MSVFAPSAFLACLIECATVFVHLLDQTIRRHSRDYFPQNFNRNKSLRALRVHHPNSPSTTSLAILLLHLKIILPISLCLCLLPHHISPHHSSVLKHRPHKRIPYHAAVLGRQLPSPHPHRPHQHHPSS